MDYGAKSHKGRRALKKKVVFNCKHDEGFSAQPLAHGVRLTCKKGCGYKYVNLAQGVVTREKKKAKKPKKNYTRPNREWRRANYVVI